jgi:hypothetical protein
MGQCLNTVHTMTNFLHIVHTVITKIIKSFEIAVFKKGQRLVTREIWHEEGSFRNLV